MYKAITVQTTYHFNPRSREGSDDHTDDINWVCTEFQSALPRGERPSIVMYLSG